MELFDAILKRGRYSEADARPVVTQIASALAYLHAQHIVHRDIKPENIRVTPAQDGASPRIKLLDFGLSKVVDVDSGSAARTFVGTPVYLAPEVEKREGATYGVEVDCWSLGAVLYVMLVARFPEFDVSPKVL